MSAAGPARPGTDDTVVSPAVELAVGLNLRDGFLAETPLVDDPALVAEVRRVGRRVAAQSDRPDLPYAFYVYESDLSTPDYQAISLPGGTIGLTRALAELLVVCEDELAFALAHEVAHVALRHHLSGVELLPDPDSGAKSFIERLRRRSEFEADRYGALYLVRAGFRYSGARDALSRIAARVDASELDLKHYPSYERRVNGLDDSLLALERSVAAFDRAPELLAAGEIDDAVTALSLFVQQFPHSVAGRVNLGTACLIRLARETGSPGGLEEPLPFLEASGIELRGMYDGEWLTRARRSFRSALAIHPTSEDALIGLALVELRAGDTRLSESFLNRAGDTDGDPTLLLIRGNIRFLDGDPEQAIRLYARALVLNQGWHPAQKNLALAYEAAGRNDRAAAAWKSLLGEPRFGKQARWQLALLSGRDD